MLIAPLALLLLLLLVLVLFVLPIWLLVSGILRVANGRRGAGRIAVATVWLLFTAFALDSTFGPLPRPTRISLDFDSDTWENYSISEMNYQTFRTRFAPFACVSTDQVEAAFPGFNRDNYAEWVRHGYLLRLRRGWYAFAEAADVPGVGDYFAGRIYSPSYLSLEYVMARCGLVPESVVQITSATSLKTASFRNAFGEFVYRSVKPELMFGYDAETVGGGLPVLVASPAKAICDFLYLNPQYSSREELEGLRLDEDVLAGLFADGSLERTAARFRSHALSARIALLKELVSP